MARGRIISKSISNSRKVNEVSDQAALLFTWIQAHTDDYGRIEGGADDVLFSVVPRRGWNKEQVEEYLKSLWEVDLLKAYHDEHNKRYVEVVGFEEHQTFRSDRGRKAQCPVPTAYDTKWYTTDNQREKLSNQVKVSKVKVSKGKSKRSVGAKVRQTETTHNAEAEVIKPPTPKERALRFFEGVVSLQNKQEVPWLQEFLNAIAQKNNNVSKQAIWNEIKAFASYWTELNSTGTREKWTLQKTFEVEKRLVTWFNRAGFKNFASTGSFAKSGKGKTIIGLDEDENEQQ